MSERTRKRLEALLTRLTIAYKMPGQQHTTEKLNRGDMRALIDAIRVKLGAEPPPEDCKGVVIAGKVLPFTHLFVRGACARCGISESDYLLRPTP